MTAVLPAGWQVHPPTVWDVRSILDLTRVSDTAVLGEPDWSAEEIVATLTAANHDPARDSWLVLDSAGDAVAWAYLDNPGRGSVDAVDVFAWPERGEPAQAPLVAMAIARVAQRAGENGFAQVTMRAAAVAADTSYVAVLRQAGFGFVRRHARMRRALTTEADTPPAGPAGGAAGGPACPPVEIRPVREDEEAELRAFHAIVGLAFAGTPESQPVDFTAWRAELAALPSVAWDEWLVASVNGEIVGVLQSSDQALDRNEGWIKNLAVRREYRRSGIGAALLRSAFGRYAAKGRTWAGLGVSLANPTGAYQLYTSVGMVATFEADVYERLVHSQ